ncbi:MAG: hypothetical protein LC114_23660 [Bryobacterales bacterium]|nr:hypothetical protein [Bryobacterales bacterium]
MDPAPRKVSRSDFVPILFLRDLKAAARKGEFSLVDSLLADYEGCFGQDACYAEFVSWAARSAASKRFRAEAQRYARSAYDIAASKLESAIVASDAPLAVAIGAAIELESGWLVETKGTPAAVEYLRRELERFGSQPLQIRIRKNLHLLSLAGQTAPMLDWSPLSGTTAGGQAIFDEPSLIVFWAHWCSDSRNQARTLSRIPRDLLSLIRLVAPTRLFGYLTKGNSAEPDAELVHLQEVLRVDYPVFHTCPIPLSSENFEVYGASTIPTLVGIQAGGEVGFFHAGFLSAEQLETRIAGLIGS